MIDSLFKAIYATRETIWKKCSEVLDGFSAFCRMSSRPMRLALVIAFALGAATVSAGSVPDRCLDECTGGEGVINVKGWAYDPDASSQSIGVHVYLYVDSGCTIQFGDVRVLTANVSRPDVNAAKGISGDHGFEADIPVFNVGDYWVKLFAIDATGDGNPQIGSTRSVTVTATGSSSGGSSSGGSSAAMTNTVKVTKFHQSYPYSGKATVEYTVGGTLPANAVAEIILNTDDASATFVQSNIVAGAKTHVIDFASSFGGALLLTNASFVVTLTTEELGGGVQLWADDGIVTYDPPETQTTPVPVAKEWIDNYPALLANQSGDYEAAANATAANGRKVWECYATGLDPSDPLDDFRITRFWMDGDMPMFEFNHTTDGSGKSILPYIKPLGKASLTNAWQHVPDGGDQAFRFFMAEVVPPGCESAVKDSAAEVVDIPVTKIWNDNSNEDGNRPASVTLRLYADGVEVDSHVLTAAENWQFTFVEKPRYQEDGKTEIVYTVGEDAVAMYAATVNGYNIVNDYQPEVTSVSVSKVWDDNNDEQSIRPDSIAMTLSDGQKTVKVVVLNEANGWTATVNNLPTVVNGQSAQYGWKEQDVLGYTLDGVTQQGRLMIFTNKVWTRPENPTAGSRPKTHGATYYVFEDYDTPL